MNHRVIQGQEAQDLLSQLFGGGDVPDEVRTEPNMQGPHGRAWKLDLTTIRSKNFDRDPRLLDDDHTVAAYIIEAKGHGTDPRVHSFLAYISDLSTAKERFIEGATHELALNGLAPVGSRDAMLVGDANLPIISPERGLFLSHLILDSHRSAELVLEKAVEDVCMGRLIIGSTNEAAESWIAQFGENAFDPGWRDEERTQKAARRYTEAMDRLDVAIAMSQHVKPELNAPSRLRGAVESARLSAEGLAALLIRKGLISEAEYVETMADEAEKSAAQKCDKFAVPAFADKANG